MESFWGNLSFIDRSLTGLEDFSSDGQKAITPSQPSLSLLYHVLASPLVVRDHLGTPFGGYATPAELDLLENYIYSSSGLSLQEILNQNGETAKVAVVVFATEYRPVADTVDGHHADLTFSRTGVARVGTARPRYLAEQRGFWPEDADNPHNIRAIPAKYSAWLAVSKKGRESRVSPILENSFGQKVKESTRDFWIPVHKLFTGGECLDGHDLEVSLKSTLFNIKLQRIHKRIGTNPLPQGYPYVIQDGDIGDFSTDPSLGPGWLIPRLRPRLIEPAIIDGKGLTYTVRAEDIDAFAAFEIPSGGPNYVHARTRVTALNGKQVFTDLNDFDDVVKEMKNVSTYQALHYLDFTGDGWITASISGLERSQLKNVPAYALVSAPDYFPSSGQFELSVWSRSNQVPAFFKESLWHIPPTPLSENRLPANLQLPESPFDEADDTITAIVGVGVPSTPPSIWPAQPDARRTSYLPDDAAGVFAPGWDTSTDTFGTTTHFAAYGLGSPFPEDAKLCAALSTFWPAVAPDVFRTFVNVEGNTNGSIAPLTDEEIGQTGSLPWDGVPGPRVIKEKGQVFVEYASFLNVDYVRLMEQNRFTIRLIAQLEVEEYQGRIIASCRVYAVLAELGNIMEARKAWLMLSFREVSAGDPDLQKAQAEAGEALQGKVYSVRMCRITTGIKVDPRIERMPLAQDKRFFVSAGSVMVIHKNASDAQFWKSRSESNS
ncbi:MAG: hypothetical protein H0X02_03490 [Nitrosomonas sp.]|nr:hypothetical protein [Nitrosomonas sp.]